MASRSRVKRLEKAYLITVIVPNNSVKKVTDAILAVDPLQYGDGYDQVAFESAIGLERYRSLPGSSPTAGSHGHRSSAPSVALSFTLPFGGVRKGQHMRKVVQAIATAHPWEEPQIFIQRAIVTKCVQLS